MPDSFDGHCATNDISTPSLTNGTTVSTNTDIVLPGLAPSTGLKAHLVMKLKRTYVEILDQWLPNAYTCTQEEFQTLLAKADNSHPRVARLFLFMLKTAQMTKEEVRDVAVALKESLWGSREERVKRINEGALFGI